MNIFEKISRLIKENTYFITGETIGQKLDLLDLMRNADVDLLDLLGRTLEFVALREVDGVFLGVVFLFLDFFGLYERVELFESRVFLGALLNYVLDHVFFVKIFNYF